MNPTSIILQFAFLCILITTPIKALSAAQHPHLYFSGAEVGNIRAYILSGERLRIAWNKFLAQTVQDRELQDWNGAACERLAFSHALLNHKEPGRAAIRLLLKAADMPTWHDGHRADREFPWHSGLRTSAMCLSVATAYDWVYSEMAPEERDTIRTALIEKGILPLLSDWCLPGSRIHALDSMGHNWWAVCLSGAGVGALAVLDEDPRARGWVRDVSRSLREWLHYDGNALLNKVPNFGPDGGFYEGLNYVNYSLLNYLRYAEALLETTGEDLLSGEETIQTVGDFLLYPAYQTSDGFLSVNFGDSPSTFVPRSTVLLDLARRTNNPKLFWYWQQATGGEFKGVFDFLWHPRNLEASPPDDLPHARLFEGIDWAILRDGWKPNGTLFALTCGDFWNHAHADAGSFILYSRGKPLIIDSGTCPYSQKEYVGYYCQSEAHNVILWNDRGQPSRDCYRGSKFRGEIRHWLSTPEYTYFCADATGPYASILFRNYRHVIAYDGLYMIVDDVLAHEAGRFSWLLHFDGDVSVNDDTVTIANPPAAADLQFAFPTGLEADERFGFEEKTRESKTYLSLDTSDSSTDKKFLALLSPRDASQNPRAPLTRLEGENWIGMRFPVTEGEADLMCNLLADGRKMHENSENDLNGFKTDAFLLLVVRNQKEEIVRLGIHNGSFVRDSRGPVFDCFSKCDAVMKIREGRVEAKVRSPGNTRVSLRCQEPAEVSLDGSAVTGQPWREEDSLQDIVLESQTGDIQIIW